MVTSPLDMFKATGASLIPEIDPMVSAMTQRMGASFRAIPELLASNQPAPQVPPASQAEGLQQWQQPGQDGSTPAGYVDDGFGFAANVPRSLIGTESGGNWAARNNEVGSGGKRGHYGILQFGNDRYAEAMNAGAVPRGMSIDSFGSNTPEGRAAQVSAANWHFSDIDKRIQSSGFDKYIGQKIGGVVMSWDGMRSMAHLGGFGGLSNYLRSGGSSNPADAYGTSLAAYGQTHQS